MKKLIVALGIFLVSSSAFAQGNVKGPATSTVGDIAVWNNTTGTLVKDQPLGAIPYLITGGAVSRNDATRWTDNWTEAPEIGVDCTGTNDSTTAIQTWANSNLSGHLRFPIGCNFFTTSTILVSSGTGITFDGATFVGDGVGSPPTWTWKGTNGGSACTMNFASCQFVLDLEHSDHPQISNLRFIAGGPSNCPDGFLKFDGNPGGGQIGTRGQIIGNVFTTAGCVNSNFTAIDISHTATNNQENYYIYNNSVFCSGVPSILARDGLTNATTTLTSASNPFSSGMVGHRVRLSYKGGLFDTTIAAFVNSGQVTLAAAVPWSQSNVMIVLDQSFGVGVRTASQNGLQHIIDILNYSNCNIGVAIFGGNAFINDPQGGQSDMGIFIGAFVSQNVTINAYASESDLQAIFLDRGDVAPTQITNSRFSNGSQLQIGHVVLANQTLFQSNLFDFGIPTANAELVSGPYTMGVAALGAITGGSGYMNGTYTNVLLSAGGPAGGTAIATIVVSGGAVTTVTITGAGELNFGGEVLTSSNSNLGGSGSGFSVVVAAAQSVAGGSGSQIISISNDYIGSGLQPNYAQTGLTNFAPPVTSFNDTLPSDAPGYQQIGCGGPVSTCLYVATPANSDTNPNIGVLANSFSAIPGHAYTAPVVGYQATSNVNSGSTYFGFQAIPPSGDFSSSDTMFEAAWNLQAISGAPGVTILPNAYGFRARSPVINGGNTLTTMYGFKCDQQKVTGIITAWCFYNDNPGDLYAFVGGTQFGTTTLATVGGEVGLARISEATPTAPGASGAKLAVVCGTNPGTAKLVIFAGTSTTPVTIQDNIGSGVSGC